MDDERPPKDPGDTVNPWIQQLKKRRFLIGATENDSLAAEQLRDIPFFGSWSICVQWTLPLPRRIGEGSND